MTVLVAILLAVFVLPHPWGVAAVAGALVFELAEAWLFVTWSQRRAVRTGVETLVGAEAVVAEPGLVRVQGELWQARGAPDARQGDRVRVRRVDGLVLDVEPL